MALPFGLKAGLKAKTIVTTAVDPTDFEKGNEEVEFSARCLTHAIVYQKNGKSIKTAEVPEQVKEQLIGTMLAGVSTGAVMSEASEVTEEMLENLPDPIKDEIVRESTPAEPTQEAVDQVAEALSDDLGFSEAEAPEIDYESMLQEAEARSVDNVNLKVLVDTLYRRFHIYLPYINQPPQRSDISPTTGSVMNAITYGQAVQGFKTAQRTGASWNPAIIRSQINAAQGSADNNQPLPKSPDEQAQVVQPFAGQEVDMPNLHGEPYRVNRRFDSPHKSAVRSERGKERDGLDPDEVYAEPPINAQSAIVRPFVTNKKSQAKLEQISRQRSSAVPQNISFDDLV